MNIVLIGAGNLATNLGKALRKAGHNILQVYSRTAASADALAAILGCSATTDLTAIDNRADVYILSIKDKALREVAHALTHALANSGTNLNEKVFLHTAGSMPLDVFKGEAPHYGVFYPMQTFSKTREVDFSIIPTFIEWSDETAHALLTALAQSVTRRVYPCLPPIANTCICQLCGLATRQPLLRHCRRDPCRPPSAFRRDAPAHRRDSPQSPHFVAPRCPDGSRRALRRNVIAAQSALLSDDPALQQLYELLSKSIHKHA